MYRCSFCKKYAPSGTSCHLVAIETRKKIYPPRSKANAGFITDKGKRIYPLRKSRKAQDRVDDPGGVGWEVVRELAACPECANEQKKRLGLEKLVAHGQKFNY